MSSRRNRGNRIVWLFDLDNTLHDAGAYVFGELHVSMGAYVQRELGLEPAEADELRRRYWLRYGATLLGLVRHHGIKPAHFLAETHRLPDLEARISGHRHDLAALRRLRGKRIVLTNAPPMPSACLPASGCSAPSTRWSRSRTWRCSARCGPSPTRACCAGWRHN